MVKFFSGNLLREIIPAMRQSVKGCRYCFAHSSSAADRGHGGAAVTPRLAGSLLRRGPRSLQGRTKKVFCLIRPGAVAPAGGIRLAALRLNKTIFLCAGVWRGCCAPPGASWRGGALPALCWSPPGPAPRPALWSASLRRFSRPLRRPPPLPPWLRSASLRSVPVAAPAQCRRDRSCLASNLR